MATIPGAMQMAMLYGFWGVTTIFLFWGALIRATRDWGGQAAQGTAFGILESGRGLTAAVVAVVAVDRLGLPAGRDDLLGAGRRRRLGRPARLQGANRSTG